jgi:6-phosphogluconate dehydrogenase
MVPAGKPTDDTIDALSGLLSKAHHHRRRQFNFKDSSLLGATGREGMHFIDSGTSGGVWGLENGYCLMVGGD